MKKTIPSAKPAPSNDINLALISVILGAASFTNTIFTGIPAIILGAMALKRKDGNQNQAKLGITFGILGSLLLIPIVLLTIYFLRKPFKQQLAVPAQDSTHIETIAKALRDYKHTNGAFPVCSQTDTESSCADWQHFVNDNPGLVTYPMQFEESSLAIKDRPPGTLVYAMRTSCLLSVPTMPGYVDDNAKNHPEDYAALVYFHDKGRACFDVRT